MESLYYSDSVGEALKKIYKLLKPEGKFFCGTDFYVENNDTAKWADDMKIPMHHYSRKEWRQLFKDAGFEVRTRQIRDAKGKSRWKRNLGTLFITGTRPRDNA